MFHVAHKQPKLISKSKCSCNLSMYENVFHLSFAHGKFLISEHLALCRAYMTQWFLSRSLSLCPLFMAPRCIPINYTLDETELLTFLWRFILINWWKWKKHKLQLCTATPTFSQTNRKQISVQSFSGCDFTSRMADCNLKMNVIALETQRWNYFISKVYEVKSQRERESKRKNLLRS